MESVRRRFAQLFQEIVAFHDNLGPDPSCVFQHFVNKESGTRSAEKHRGTVHDLVETSDQPVQLPSMSSAVQIHVKRRWMQSGMSVPVRVQLVIRNWVESFGAAVSVST